MATKKKTTIICDICYKPIIENVNTEYYEEIN